MALLVHLNGLPGAGKSTLARRYVDDRPLALNVDVDLLRRAFGRWDHASIASGLQARRLALELARVHLRDGYDVVVPQFVARPEFVSGLREVAADVGAAFVEVVLRARLDTVEARFASRTARAAEAQHVEAARMLGPVGLRASLEAMSRDLDAMIESQVDHIEVATEGLTPEQAYLALCDALARVRPGDEPSRAAD